MMERDTSIELLDKVVTDVIYYMNNILLMMAGYLVFRILISHKTLINNLPFYNRNPNDLRRARLPFLLLSRDYRYSPQIGRTCIRSFIYP